MTDDTEPKGELTTRTMTMPADTNGAGDIFGGWVMSQMDIAGAIAAVERAQKRVVTVAVNAMRFHAPVHVSDVVCCYTDIARIGRTSITVHVEVWVLRGMLGHRHRVTEADFTYVALGPDGQPTPIENSSDVETKK